MLRSSQLLFVAIALVSCGCSSRAPGDAPPLASVSGIVTLNGQPLSGAIVMFEPQKTGSISAGVTDAQGRYEVAYRTNLKGAAVGPHVVRISKTEMEAGPETLPVKYNMESELIATVTPEGNSFDFPLTKGKSKK
jgi:hypothetical protein